MSEFEELSIGAFARRVGLTPSALRFYDDCGLLRPRRVDAASGYRYYGPEQERRGRLLRDLRRAGLPLPEARVVLDGPPPRARAVLDGHLRRTREAACAAAAAVGDVLRTLPATAASSVTIRVGGPELAAAIRQVTPSAATPARKAAAPAGEARDPAGEIHGLVGEAQGPARELGGPADAASGVAREAQGLAREAGGAAGEVSGHVRDAGGPAGVAGGVAREAGGAAGEVSGHVRDARGPVGAAGGVAGEAGGPAGAAGEECDAAGEASGPAAVLCGLLFEAVDGELRVVATDRYRLSVRVLHPVEAVCGTGRVVVGVAAARRLASWAAGAVEPVVEITPAALLAHDPAVPDGEGPSLDAIAGTYPDYAVVLDGLAPARTRLITAREALTDALAARHNAPYVTLTAGPAPTVTREDTAPGATCGHDTPGTAGAAGTAAAGSAAGGTRGVEAEPAAGTDVLRVAAPGHAEVALPVVRTGEAAGIAFDPRVLAAALDTGVGPDVVLEIAGPCAPVVVRSADQGTFTTLAMPIRPDASVAVDR